MSKQNTMEPLAQRLDVAFRHHAEGDFAAAEPLYNKILHDAPDYTQVHYLLGVLNIQKGDHQTAVPHLQRAIALQPENYEAHNSIAVALVNLQQHEAAIQHYIQAIQLNNHFADAYYNLGTALDYLGQHDEAITVMECAIREDPTFNKAYSKLGNAYKRANRLQDAEQILRKLNELQPDLAEGHYLLGNVLELRSDIDGAIEAYSRAVARDDGATAARWNRSLMLLLQGRYREAWPDYEAGLIWGERPDREFLKPRWDGSLQADKTILVWAEQGYGDCFQFVRFLQPLRKQFSRVVFLCKPGLEGLLANTAGIDDISESDESEIEYDYHVPLLSLAGLLEVTLDNLTADCPYIAAEESKLVQWQKTLSQHQGFKVGITWSGNTAFKANDARSCRLENFLQLNNIPGVTMFSLQKGEAAEQVNIPADIIDLGGQICSFSDTAALIEQLDLVISVDTALAHLAGAMGRPVWVLLQKIPDWRWLLEGADSPWYPGMRLFRQPEAGDWGSVFAEVRTALAGRITQQGAAS